MDKNIKEKERLYQWACKYNSAEIVEKIFPSIEVNENSYFTKRRETGNYLREYNFQELPELRHELEMIWNKDACMEEIITTVLVGAYKNRIEVCAENIRIIVDSEDELSPYIYNF